jgi:FMN phosphatase YigB (HAD superfamily)
MVRALLFDFGGVVLDHDFALAFESWEQVSPLGKEELASRFAHDEPYERHERGELAASDYFAHLRETLQLEASDERIAQGWNAIFIGVNEPATALVHEARKTLSCYAFTNTNPTHQSVWMRDLPGLSAPFDRVFVSSEMGLRKPEREAFDAVVSAMDVTHQEVLFFDDLAENVEGARDAGLEAVLVRSTEDVRAALRQVGAIE